MCHHSFNKYLLNAYHVPCTVEGAEDTNMSKTIPFLKNFIVHWVTDICNYKVKRRIEINVWYLGITLKWQFSIEMELYFNEITLM